MIRLKNINKVYSNGSIETKALNGLNLDIAGGEDVAIVGSSGSGKSSLLNIIGCLDARFTGEYLLDGYNIHNMNPTESASIRRKKIGFVFQQYQLIPDMSVYENVELPLLYAQISKQKRKKMVVETLKKMNIEEKRNNKPSELSGGQQQRVAIARAIVTNPSYILADEPTGALDSNTGESILCILKEINRTGTGLIIVTHDVSVANSLNRVITLHDGKIIKDLRYI